MSSRDLYSFEYGSGSTWGSYLLPADAYRLYVCSKGKIHLGPVVPSSIEFNGVHNLTPIGSDEFRKAVAECLNREKK